jgi:S-DNA-T family DNA segregation ATPase FtsK/SpoIIIE
MQEFGSDQFLLGKTRAKDLVGSLLETPHILIGGQTGGGKSTFLRQLITTLYCNNKNYKFSLIDMKNGLEFQLFEHRDRVTVFSEVKTAAKLFDRLESELKNRMKVLKENKCKDMGEFSALPVSERIMPAGTPTDIDVLSRHVIVIDEAAELFFASSKRKPEDVQKIVRIATTIAAQGRAVGLHLIIATQKPDANAVSTQIKANLTGIISFQMATLGASMSIMGNGRATELPSIPGRAIWKAGMDMDEIQTPFMSPDQAKIHLDKIALVKETLADD